MRIPISPSLARRLASSLALAALSAAPLAAQSGTYVDSHVRSGYQRHSDPLHQIHVDHYDCGPTAAPISGSCGVPGLSVSAAASATPGGVLRARTSMTATGAAVALTTPPPADIRNTFFSASSGSGLWDRITFGTLTPAAVRFNYFIDGTFATTVAGSPPNYASAYVNVGFSASQPGTGPGTWTELFVDGIIGSTSQSRSIAHYGFHDYALNGGSFLDFLVSINTWVDVGAGVGTAGAPIWASGTSDFSHTALLGIQALDAQGNDITAAAGLVFASGAAYPTPNTAVPEPSTWALLATGLLALGGVARRRRSSAAA